jgi:hypothetical protein
LSQKDAKRPASKDINDLKARLGLKKGGAAAGPAPAPAPRNTGVVAPPGLNLPPPPGVRPSQQQPAIPNAADDPFGAMSAMAQAGQVQRGPEIIVVNDGAPVEKLSSGEKAKRTGKLAGIIVAPLVVGLLVGQTAKANKSYNAGLADAKALQQVVAGMRQQLTRMRSAFEASGSDEQAAKELTAALDDIKKKTAPVAMEAIFRAKMNTLDAKVAGGVLGFYAAAQDVQRLVEEHVTLAATEEQIKAVSAAQVSALAVKDGILKETNQPYKLGLVLHNAADPDPGMETGAKLVELGRVLCGESAKASTPNESGLCPNGDIFGFEYRYGASQRWIPGKLNRPGSLDSGEKYPLDEVIVITPNETLGTLVKTANVTLAEQAYFNRLGALKEKIDAAVEKGEAVESALKAKSAGGKRFTFFL